MNPLSNAEWVSVVNDWPHVVPHVTKYTVMCNKYNSRCEDYTPLGTLYVHRQLPDASKPPKIVSFTSSINYSHLIYDDGYVCDVWHSATNIPPLMSGVFIEDTASREDNLMMFYYNKPLLVDHDDDDDVDLRVDLGDADDDDEVISTCDMRIVTIGDVLKFDNRSARCLLLDADFTRVFWRSLLGTWHVGAYVIKTKTDYLYIAEYYISKKDRTEPQLIYVVRPLDNLEHIPNIKSFISCYDYTQLTYDDGYVCNIWNDNHAIPPLMNGMLLWSRDRDNVIEYSTVPRGGNSLEITSETTHGVAVPHTWLLRSVY